MSTEHDEYAASLRQLADWIQNTPHIPLPSFHINNYNLDTQEQAAELVRAFGSCKKRYFGDMFYVNRMFGVIRYEFTFYRSSVCTPRVVGVETTPAVFVEAHTIPARTKDIIEWECLPILAEREEGGDRPEGED